MTRKYCYETDDEMRFCCTEGVHSLRKKLVEQLAAGLKPSRTRGLTPRA